MWGTHFLKGILLKLQFVVGFQESQLGYQTARNENAIHNNCYVRVTTISGELRYSQIGI